MLRDTSSWETILCRPVCEHIARDINQSGGSDLAHRQRSLRCSQGFRGGKLELRERNVKIEQIVFLEALVAVEPQSSRGGVLLKSVLFCGNLGTFIYGDKTKADPESPHQPSVVERHSQFTPAGGTGY